MLAACGVGEASDPVPPIEAFVAEAWPALSSCTACHGRQPGIDFLAPGEARAAYATLFAYQPALIDLDAPASSLLLAMGEHSGPALAPRQVDAVRGWIQDERAWRLGPEEPPTVVGPFEVVVGGTTVVDLGPAGAPGAELAFGAEAIESGLYLTDITILAGGGGARVTHPMFVSHPTGAAPLPDPADRFGDVDLEIPPETALALGAGRALFVGFAPTDPIRVHFRALEVLP